MNTNGTGRIVTAARAAAKRYAAAVLAYVLAELIRLPLDPPTLIPFITYVPFILLSAWYGGRGPALLTGALSVAGVIWFAVEPTHSFRIANSHDYLGVAALAVSAVTIAVLFEKLHAAARELERRGEELQRSNADLQAYAYSVSHDLQEPLRNVSLYTDLLRRRCGDCIHDDPARGHVIGVIGDGARRMSAMLSGLLIYSRVTSDSDTREWIDTQEALANALGLLASRVEQTGAVVTVGPLPRLYAWRAGIDHLFQNLLANAMKYRCPSRPLQIAVTCVRDGEAWRFSVADNGIGFDPQYAEQIFGVFRRLHGPDKYAGAGLGLAIARRIVHRHGGHIWAAAREGEGATFCFTIPQTS